LSTNIDEIFGGDLRDKQQLIGFCDDLDHNVDIARIFKRNFSIAG